jgi:hypothetical protein
MTLVLGQLAALAACITVPLRCEKAKGFVQTSGVNSLTFIATGQALDVGSGAAAGGQLSWTLTLVIATGSLGRSFPSRGAETILSTTSIPFVTSPNSV